MREIPALDRFDVVFGNINHLPPYDEIPDEFKQSRGPYVDFVGEWFFSGRTQGDIERLKEREGVDRAAALNAIKAILNSFQSKHEHKEAGCAYLLSEWFDLVAEKQLSRPAAPATKRGWRQKVSP